MKVGDRVRVSQNESRTELRGLEGVIKRVSEIRLDRQSPIISVAYVKLDGYDYQIEFCTRDIILCEKSI